VLMVLFPLFLVIDEEFDDNDDDEVFGDIKFVGDD
jgi:hypothetical protein